MFSLAAAYKLPCQVHMSVLVPSGMCFRIRPGVSVNQAKREFLGTVLSPESVLCWDNVLQQSMNMLLVRQLKSIVVWMRRLICWIVVAVEGMF